MCLSSYYIILAAYSKSGPIQSKLSCGIVRGEQGQREATVPLKVHHTPHSLTYSLLGRRFTTPLLCTLAHLPNRPGERGFLLFFKKRMKSV
jgi:hypothetical protein